MPAVDPLPTPAALQSGHRNRMKLPRYGPMAPIGSSGKLTVLNGRTRPLISDG
jgi:hypothetical protein